MVEAVYVLRVPNQLSLDAGLDERRTVLDVARAAVEAAGAGLGVEHDALRAGGARLLLREREQAGADAASAGLTRDDQASEPAGRAREQQPARPDHLATANRHEVQSGVVEAVDLLLVRNALLTAEHPNAELGRRRALVRVAGAAKHDGRSGGAHGRQPTAALRTSPSRGGAVDHPEPIPDSGRMGVCWESTPRAAVVGRRILRVVPESRAARRLPRPSAKQESRLG